METKEYKVGEVFQFGMKKLKCEGGGCDRCVFSDWGCHYAASYVGKCVEREDHKSVCFVEVKEENKGL